jgi:hypothetical protein
MDSISHMSEFTIVLREYYHPNLLSPSHCRVTDCTRDCGQNGKCVHKTDGTNVCVCDDRFTGDACEWWKCETNTTSLCSSNRGLLIHKWFIYCDIPGGECKPTNGINTCQCMGSTFHGQNCATQSEILAWTNVRRLRFIYWLCFINRYKQHLKRSRREDERHTRLLCMVMIFILLVRTVIITITINNTSGGYPVSVYEKYASIMRYSISKNEYTILSNQESFTNYTPLDKAPAMRFQHSAVLYNVN